MILIVTNKLDPHADVVIQHLNACEERFIRLNTEDFPEKIAITWELKNNISFGTINAYNMHKVDLSKITAVWYRRPEKAIVSSQLKTPEARKFAMDESHTFLQGLYKLLKNRFWINYPFQVHETETKMANLALAASLGLATPKTIITSDLKKAKVFLQGCPGKVLAKVLNIPIVEKKGNYFAIYSNIVTKRARKRLNSITFAPTQLQEYIEKKIELRITVVGRKIFACEIHSQDSEQTKIDWRHYDFDNVKHCKHTLPKDIKQKILKMQKVLGLNYGAYDFILTPKGEYVFIELNPNGQYLWIERLTKMPISKAIADLLIRGKK